ncbi:MAG TPA: pseudouridine synthase [Bacilli bacterium]|nr:pseudouridine synthase [Bacilli bacterium]
MERLQKVIASAGVCSRRKAEELIKQGKVKVNNSVVTEMGFKVGLNDKVTVNNQELKNEQKEYYLFYKPKSVLSTTSDDKGRKTVLNYFDTKARIYPVGRLDYDTTGVLLLTNDGDFANLMMHPSSNIEKVYVAKIEGVLNGEEIHTLKEGFILDKELYKVDKLKIVDASKSKNTSIIKIMIHEGKNHHIKKLFEHINKNIIKLKRESYSFLDLGNLKPGEWRRLNPKEIKKLYSLIKK